MKYLATCPYKILSCFMGSTLRSTPALRAPVERAYKRVAEPGDDSHCPLDRMHIPTLGLSNVDTSL